MTIRIDDTAPDFEADTTEGRIRFHEWIGDGWAVLFSHPKDFTPVCTTELGYMARIKPEFDKRGVKIIGISVDPVEDHHRWVKDIEETQGTAPNYPMIGDTELKIAKLYDMLPAGAGDSSAGRTPADNATVRNVFVIGPDKKVKLVLVYPMSHRAQLRRGAAGDRFDAAHRQALGRDAGQLEQGRRRDRAQLDPDRRGEEALRQGRHRDQALPADHARPERVTARSGAHAGAPRRRVSPRARPGHLGHGRAAGPAARPRFAPCSAGSTSA